jgi:hypothetical protein
MSVVMLEEVVEVGDKGPLLSLGAMGEPRMLI